MITILHSLKDQARFTDERHLLIINFLCKTWQKVIEGGEFKSKTEFDFSTISISYKNWSKVIKNRRFKPEIDMNYLTI